jgi:tetratricopeptide (TPR) repeat protein
MTDNTKSTNSPALPPTPALGELFRNYLQRQTAAQGEGLGFADVSGEVVPHEAIPLQPADPQLAWIDALAVAPHLVAGGKTQWQVPPEWPTLVALQEPAVDLAFCLGNFPQMVRMLQPLLTMQGGVRPSSPGRAVPVGGLTEWAKTKRSYPDVLFASAALRLAKLYDEAENVLKQAGQAPAQWQALRANEEAALLWHRGEREMAFQAWKSQNASTPVLFNRGMAAIFLGRFGEAQESLSQAVNQLPETSAWHHLGQMYLALAQARA